LSYSLSLALFNLDNVIEVLVVRVINPTELTILVNWTKKLVRCTILKAIIPNIPHCPTEGKKYDKKEEIGAFSI
jgi:hypothetical protein